jgi:hypothetical protein
MTFDTNADGSTNRIFVQLSNLHGFAVVDFTKHTEISRVMLPKGNFGKEEWRMGTPSHGIAVAPDGKTLWVNSVLANAIFEYSLPDLKLLGHADLPVVERPGKPSSGAVPEWITFTPDNKPSMYQTPRPDPCRRSIRKRCKPSPPSLSGKFRNELVRWCCRRITMSLYK